MLDRLPVIDKGKVCLDNAYKRILAEKIVAKIDDPNFNRASMDGYAIRSQDTLEAREDRLTCLKLTGCVAVGSLPESKLNQARRLRSQQVP